ncbi:MAG: hypothetical protein A3H57_03880 [Candidatus Taylorbacteria bacterium RIFCSPLOWO2_02_FULL_43_11]|uniref:DOD-type homing endonuclease domain-containing protein n=1 Tax=Candidatus Taylorbacteria bacterium RIFCSPHIGHO2_02_FULL_43_32b TaxID=1802306 RepID=A0A1G2MJG1_9BACT|nr:MAG: hypothetical protein A2743_01355 [Candidatus Taylorbacteria bacterium RIFCSPHIGHO2_01_FULL_43_47]OHA24060.1 MAG: hypothetical protein A3C72_02910 [Candidatus Taylorbacteria bacterium RIFCSPHIGHO2_02_FULL_43_32b]OHA31476.1 MAG: hypothetical protein A3B08_00835 [Candidatus Taylorbacteria bacterium RIFCSPLOWO2_01_FULL_43_44]OHA37527.1 MAG: hypothetical protein A3H57_03880 [Candidatus Taylorbacteria bacterium RIFCSPLOWO2_02_FULL_43_11]
MSLLDKIFPKKDAGDSPQIASVLPADIYEAGALELRDVIAPSALKVSPKSINLGNKIVRTYFVISYPRFLTEGWFAPIINLDKVFDISIFIHPIDTARVLKQFQKKVAEVQSQINEREKKGFVRDPILETAYNDLEKLRDDLMQAQEKMFDVGLYMSIYGESDEELDKIETEVRSILESKLVYVKPALFQEEQAFRSIAPLGTDEIMVHTKLNSSPLSSLFPFISFDMTSDKGILYGINRHNASLVLFDRFSLENYNSVTLAQSGSGKSIKGNEPVLIKQNGKISLRPIGSVVDKLIRKRGAVQIDEEMDGVIDPGLEVYSFDKNMKGSWSKVSVAARKIAPKQFYRFKTKSGRAVVTTGDHNMLVLRNGEIVATKSDNVGLGEAVPLPRSVETGDNFDTQINLLELLKNRPNIYVAGAAKEIKLLQKEYEGKIVNSRFDKYLYKYHAGRRIPIAYFLKLLRASNHTPQAVEISKWRVISSSGTGSLPAIFPISKEFMRIIGYIISEGTIRKEAVIISNTEKEVLDDISDCLKKMGLTFFRNTKSIRVGSVVFVNLIHALGLYKKSAGKCIPGIAWGTSTQSMAALLSSYFEGDGGVDGPSITAVSKSKRLISELSYFLFFFGIVGRVHKREKKYVKTGKKRTFWHISISGQSSLNSFAEKIGFVSKRKNALLSSLLNKNENTNVDTIPTLGQLVEELTLIFPYGINGTSNFQKIKWSRFDPTPKYLRKATDELEEKIEEFVQLGQSIKILSQLPKLHNIIAIAKENKEVNTKLWNLLGSSWAWMRNETGAPRAENALALIEAVGLTSPSVSAIKTAVHDNAIALHLPMKHMDASLRSAITIRPESNTSYEMLQKAASFISTAYQEWENNLPRVKEIISILRTLIESELFFDPITKINTIENKSEKYVYDLTVDNEVFLAGYGGMFVHNSYATKLEILRSLMFDTEVIVIDPEREYEQLAEAAGGKYFNISLNSEHHINPFDLPAPREDEQPSDVLRSHIINLVGLFRIMLGGLTPEEDAIVDRAITETYALKDITPDENFANSEPPLLSDFETVLAGMEGASSLHERLTKYSRGTWSGFINQPSNISIDSKFVVFSIRDMEDELKAVATYLITNHIWAAIRKTLKRRLLIIDEAWWMMKSEDTASFLARMVKRGRKYYLGVATITQDVDDFLKSPYGTPIITNSSMQILLKQSPTTIDRLQQIFQLTDEEKYLLLESAIGEGIFFVGLKHVAIKIIGSYTEDQIITSDPHQLLTIKKAKEELRATEG